MLGKNNVNSQNSNIISDLTAAKNRLIKRGIASESTIYGCDEAQILKIQKEVNFSLPIGYVKFLECMGCGAGSFFDGTDLFFPTMIGNNEAAIEILEELSDDLVLPEKAFVFAMHQGYQFFFFQADSDNPPVYYYMEGNNQFDFWNKSFTEFLKQMAFNT